MGGHPKATVDHSLLAIAIELHNLPQTDKQKSSYLWGLATDYYNSRVTEDIKQTKLQLQAAHKNKKNKKFKNDKYSYSKFYGSQ